MLTKRNLLSSEVNENIVNCINGYIADNTMICQCYPGWTSNYDSLNQCDVDTGLNNTKSNSGLLNSNYNNNSPSTMIFLIGFIILALILIICIFLYLYKKWKDIKLVKQKIKYEKNKNKKIEHELSLNLEDIDTEKGETTQSSDKLKKNKSINKKDSMNIRVRTHEKRKSPFRKRINSLSTTDE